MVPRDRVNAAGAGAGASSAAVAQRLVHGPALNKRCEKKVSKKIHKSEREKLKRDKQNDLFTELGTMLEPDRQNNGKACILSDTTRILKELLSQVESLRKENSALKNESHYVALERNELHDDNSMLHNEILELQNELRMRLEGNPIWSQATTRSALTVSHATNRVFPLQHSPHLPVVATATLPPQQPVVIEQCYTAPPRELQLFPEAASTEDSELSQDQENPNNVTRPQARYRTPMETLPVNRFPILPRMVDEQQCSSGTTGTSGEDGLGRA